MNSDIIIRNIKLSLLSNVDMKEPYLSIYNDLKDIFSDLNIYTSDEYPNKSFFGKSKNDLYIRYDSKNERIWLDRANVWSKFESKYDLSYKSIQGITTWYLGNTLQMKGTTMGKAKVVFPNGLGNTLQMKGTTMFQNDISIKRYLGIPYK